MPQARVAIVGAGPAGAFAAASLRRAAGALGVPLAVVELASAALRDAYEADLVLVRPDQVIAWRGAADVDAADVLACVAGWPHRGGARGRSERLPKIVSR